MDAVWLSRITQDYEYLERYPKLKEFLIDWEKEFPPESCIKCLFFKWVFKDGKTDRGTGTCQADMSIELNETELYDFRASGCPIDK